MPDELGPFATMEAYLATPRLAGLAASPEGRRVVTTVAELDDDGAQHVPAIWELDLGGGPARRLTRSKEGERSPAFAADGSLLFLSDRTRPGGGDHDPTALWLLPAGGGEAHPVATPAGAVVAVAAARHAPVVVLAVQVAPGGRTGDDERAWRDARRTRKVTAVLHEQSPLREWDHERGPEEVHLFAASLPERPGAPLGELRDLTPDAGLALLEAAPVLSDDGATVVVPWVLDLPAGQQRYDLVAIDVATAERTTLAGDADGTWLYGTPAVSPAGRVACIADRLESPTEASASKVVVVGFGEVATGDLWPRQLAWLDDDRLVVGGDRRGHAPLLVADLRDGGASDLAADGAWHDPVVADGEVVALRSHIDSPPRPVLLGDGGRRELDAPGGVDVPGRLEEVTATAADGTELRAWLALPAGADPAAPAPLAVFLHGGPLGSWNDWTWRWNPWLMTARGWAVALPDPAYSTGYGQVMVDRGHLQWGGNPYDDVMALTDAAEAHPAVDATVTVAMGGSYGGYMANWVASHTDRFKAIVSHASIWDLAQFQATTDAPWAWAREWGTPAENPELYRRWSPSAHVDAISTPMLVIHGAFDFRCPISESLRLFNDLVSRGKVAKFLAFPDEGHWVLRPGDAAAWYATVWAFLDHHALGRPWQRPELL